MGGRRIIEEDVDSHGLFVFVIGAIAGAAAGAYLGRRYDTVDELLEGVQARLAEFRDTWVAGEDDDALPGDDEDDEDEDEDEIVDEEEEEDETTTTTRSRRMRKKTRT